MHRLVRALLIFGALSLLTAVAPASSERYPGVVLPPGAVLTAQPAGEVTDLYVNAVIGEDGEGCGTDPLTPCRTIQPAIDRVSTVIRHDVTVHVAAGTYPGGILIAARTSPNKASLRLVGEGGEVVIDNCDLARTGISVLLSSNIVIENLVVRGFPVAGVAVHLSTGVVLRSVTLAGNGDGVCLAYSDTCVMGGAFLENRHDGVMCEGGWVRFVASVPPSAVLFGDNVMAGLEAADCRASIETPVSVTGSYDGFLAVHGGEINLNMRGDISISPNGAGSALTADASGMVNSYSNSCNGSCTCTALRYGVCEPGPANGGGARRGPVQYESP